jgi:hypothetical protein
VNYRELEQLERGTLRAANVMVGHGSHRRPAAPHQDDTWVENLLRAHAHNLDRIDPQLQRLDVADPVRLTPDPYLGRLPVAVLHGDRDRPREALVMVQQPPTGAITSWSFVLRPQGAAAPRLLAADRGERVAGPRDRRRAISGEIVIERPVEEVFDVVA